MREDLQEQRELQERREEELLWEMITRLKEGMRLQPELVAEHTAMLEEIEEKLRVLRVNLGSDSDGEVEVEDEGNL